jgi:hypothetical protein
MKSRKTSVPRWLNQTLQGLAGHSEIHDRRAIPEPVAQARTGASGQKSDHGCALVTAGQVAQVPYHLNRAMDNGLTRTQASEVLTQLAFVAGWPNVFSAMPVFKEVFAGRDNA